MAGQVDHKSQVLAATDIVELIRQTVNLKRSGSGFVGLCPFHNEKTGSFSVSPSRQAFYCFGCKAGGNAIDFVMKRDRIEFIEALKLLAEQAHIDLPKFTRKGESANERQAILDIQSAAGAFFQHALASPAGEPARAYLEKRGFDAGSAKTFQIGYAPPGWDNLLKSEAGRKYAPDLLVKAGLAKHNQDRNSYYDTFRNRLMFPIRDEQARVIAFGGRVMPGSDDPAKYMNSPETPVFSKSRCAYGLDLARQRIVETRTVIVVEGYCDVIGCHQFGVTNVVSVLGTALTAPHVNLLRRYADRIVLLFDPDLAGDLAVNRAVELFLTQPIEVLIATLPDQLDPDEYLLEHGTEAFNQVIASAQDALSYKWKQLTARFISSQGDLTGQQKAVEEYMNTLADARASAVDSLRWHSSLARVSRLTSIPVEELNRRFKMVTRPPSPKPQAESSPTPPDGQNSEPAAPTPSSAPKEATAQVSAERHLLGCLLLDPPWWHEAQKTVSPDDFLDPPRHKLAEVYWDYQRNEGEPVFSELLDVLRTMDLAPLAMELVHECEPLDVMTTINAAVEYLQYARQKRSTSRLNTDLRRNTESGSEGAALDNLKKLTELARQPDLRRGV